MAENEPKQGLLSFEEFTEPDKVVPGIPTYNNFGAFFMDGYVGNLYRSKDVWKKFAEAHPKESESLRNKLGKEHTPYRPDVEKLLYDAYRLMAPFTDDPKDLFT